MSTFLKEKIDYARHNDGALKVMRAYEEGTPIRVPLMVDGSITNYFYNRELNTRGLTFEEYFTDAKTQITAQLEYEHWKRHNLLCDRPMGLPEDGWRLFIDFQNSYDASWAGAPVRYDGLFLPDTEPILAERKEMLYDMPDPLPFDGGLIGMGLRFYHEMVDYCKRNEFMGLPIHPPSAFAGEGTDGVLDLAYKLRGAENVLTDMLLDENYFHDLLSYITRNLIHRIKKLRKLRWEFNPASPDKGEHRRPGFGFADDALSLISADMYRTYILPYHRRLMDEFSNGERVSFHLCGDAMRHFPILVDELNVTVLDTGFPVDHGLLRRRVGPGVTIQGGPTVMTLKDGPAEKIENEARGILHSGVMDGGKFVMIVANNLAPLTPVENIAVLYDAVKRYGNYG